MDDYLSKPVKTDDLGFILQRWAPLPTTTDIPAPVPRREMTKTDARVFDAAAMLANIGGDAELFEQLIRLFLDRHGLLMKEIETAIGQTDASALEQAAHGLQGAPPPTSARRTSSCWRRPVRGNRSSRDMTGPFLLVQLDRTVQELVSVLSRQISPPPSS
ncbi:MAG: hypothetical protein R3B08_05915 [Nitrospira sp.]